MRTRKRKLVESSPAGFMMESLPLPAEAKGKPPAADGAPMKAGRFPPFLGMDKLGVPPAELGYTPVQLGSCCIRPGQEPELPPKAMARRRKTVGPRA